MGMLRLLLLALALASLPSAAAAATYTLTPAQDTDIRANGGGTSNCGSCAYLQVRRHSTGEHHALYQFDLSSIPAGARIVSATLRIYVTTADNTSVTVHRVTQAWSEATLTWANSGGVAHDAASSGSFTPASSGRYYDVNVASLVSAWRSGTANHGVLLKFSGGNNIMAIFTSRDHGTVAIRPQLVVVADPPPSFMTVLSSPVTSDPVNGTTNPKAIPGAAIYYSLNVTNSSAGYPDSNAVVVVQPVPANTALFVRDLIGAGTGPVRFVQGAPSSGLTYTYTSLGSGTDDISFSNNGGSTWSYTPVADASGYDAAVTHVRINPKGTFAGASAAGNPSFTLSFRVKVN